MNRMFHCGIFYDRWVKHALRFLPPEILDRHKDRLAFYSTAQRDGFRIARAIREEREIILLSERILPKRRAKDYDGDVRYFIFVVLHEVAHAVMKHHSPLYDGLTPEAVAAEEKQADDLAFSWLNAHL
jgi:hypothetical protein